jgi:hypothetical protein
VDAGGAGLDVEAIRRLGEPYHAQDGPRVGLPVATVEALLADNARLRARIHEAVDEVQRRYAGYQSRCDQFDDIARWARTVFEAGGMSWDRLSVAERAIITLTAEERDTARAEVARLTGELDEARGDLAAEREPVTDGEAAP